MTPEEKRQYKREYYRKNKEKVKKEHQAYRERNKDKIKEASKKYYEKNKEKRAEKNKEQKKEYYKTPNGIKNRRIGVWKVRGVICDDWDVLYERYLNTELCELCNVELTEDKKNTTTTRCLDHDHTTGEVRNIVCHSCNIKRG